MKRYRLLDDTEVKGRTFADIVRAMGSMKLEKPHSRSSYREATASRARDMYGVKVDASTDANFVRSMVTTGLLVEIDSK